MKNIKIKIKLNITYLLEKNFGKFNLVAQFTASILHKKQQSGPSVSESKGELNQTKNITVRAFSVSYA